MQKKFNPNDITHTDDIREEMKSYLEKLNSNRFFIITDEICENLCYSLIKDIFPNTTPIFSFKIGEKFKTLKTVTQIWDFLFNNEAERNSLIINIGGGIVTDIGGFAASTYKRGIPFINIPTTLLAQIDASVGGKTGINYNGLKNQIGTITLPDKVFICPVFLKTLKYDDFLSGFGEMLKHALIFDKNHYSELIHFIKNDFPKKNYQKLNYLIKKSVNIKLHFVKNDFNEKNLRKTLNFGHTLGHALESYFIEKEKPVKHGISVIYGVICELWISVKKSNFDKTKFIEISDELLRIFNKIYIPEKDFEIIFNYMKHDKKNNNKSIQTVLLKHIETPVIETVINKKEIFESLNKLNALSK